MPLTEEYVDESDRTIAWNSSGTSTATHVSWSRTALIFVNFKKNNVSVQFTKADERQFSSASINHQTFIQLKIHII